MTNDSLLEFWMQTQTTICELSDKAKTRPLTESEAMMLASMCRAVEEYYRIQSILLEVERLGLQDKWRKLLNEETNDTQ